MLARQTLLRVARPHVRTLCLAQDVASKIVELKEVAASTGSSGYSVADFKSDLAAGKVDASKLGETMAFSDKAKKMALKMNAEINIARMAGEKDVSLDWGAWGEKITTPGLVDKIQAAADAELAATLAEADLDKKSESIKAQIKAVFSGSNGLYEMASKEEKAADAGLLQCIAELELLEKQVDGVSTQTIAEILEQEPELRKEVEEEVANNVWAP